MLNRSVGSLWTLAVVASVLMYCKVRRVIPTVACLADITAPFLPPLRFLPFLLSNGIFSSAVDGTQLRAFSDACRVK